jgi:hypothetical protein
MQREALEKERARVDLPEDVGESIAAWSGEAVPFRRGGHRRDS